MSSNNDITELNPEDLEKSQSHPRSKSRSFSPPHSPSFSPPHSPSFSPPHSPSFSPLQDERKYIFIGFFIHGAYGSGFTEKVDPYHAAKSLRTFRSTPKLMTFTNSSPGNIVLGNADGSDNTKLKNFFKTNSIMNLMAGTNQNENKKDQDQIIAKNFLNYSKNGLATLPTNPRNDLEIYRKTKTAEKKYVSRNSFILNNKVGIGYTFPNKSFTTDDPSADAANMDSWGIFIFNNNCGIEPGTRIEELFPDMAYNTITNEDGDDIGIKYYLKDIEYNLTIKYGLTPEDYLFLFDFTCSVIKEEPNPRTIRSFSRQIAKDLGFGIKRTKKRNKKRNKKVNKKGSKKIKLKQKVFKN